MKDCAQAGTGTEPRPACRSHAGRSAHDVRTEDSAHNKFKLWSLALAGHTVNAAWMKFSMAGRSSRGRPPSRGARASPVASPAVGTVTVFTRSQFSSMSMPPANSPVPTHVTSLAEQSGL